jgi:hypothetical protein
LAALAAISAGAGKRAEDLRETIADVVSPQGWFPMQSELNSIGAR